MVQQRRHLVLAAYATVAEIRALARLAHSCQHRRASLLRLHRRSFCLLPEIQHHCIVLSLVPGHPYRLDSSCLGPRNNAVLQGHRQSVP